MLSIDGIHVSGDLYSRAKSLRQIGSKCFLAIEDATTQDPSAPVQCSHCNGSGHQYLQHVTGGPYDVAPSGKGASVICENGKWYTVKTSAYHCVCRPMIQL